jgi:hypothetical protein
VKLGQAGELCQDYVDSVPWLGIFSYEAVLKSPQRIMDAVFSAAQKAPLIDSIAYGKDRFARFWYPMSADNNDEEVEDGEWRVYDVKNVASSYFIGHLIDYLTVLDKRSSSFAWFPLKNGVQPKVLAKKAHP